MDDMLFCPICNNKLRTYVRSIALPQMSLQNFNERTCTLGINHTLQFLSLDKSKKIHWIKMSLDINYSKYLEVNFISDTSCILLANNGIFNKIEIDKKIELDFPSLSKTLEKVNTYVTFS